MYNASERKDIRRAEKAARAHDLARVEFIRAAMSTIQGRVWFHQLLSICHIFADPFSGDALREAYSKGERNVGLMVYMDIVQNCPNEFTRMMQEAQVKEITDGRRDDHPADDATPSEHVGGEDRDGGAEEPVESDRWVDYTSARYSSRARDRSGEV